MCILNLLKRNSGPHLFVNWANANNLINSLLNIMDMGKPMVKIFLDLLKPSQRKPKKETQQRREMNWISKKVMNPLLSKYKRKFISG